VSVEFNTFCAVGDKEIPAKLFYSSDDPAVLEFTFYNTGKTTTSARWIFARDLIHDAFNSECGESGIGDIRVEADNESVLFWITSNDGDALATFERAVIDEFMECVYDEVPEGEDHYEIPDEFPEEWLV